MSLIKLRSVLWSLAVVCQLIADGDSDVSNFSNTECKSSSDSSTSHKICLTPECTKAAADILLNINQNVDPCDDFYKFACGGWRERRTIPDGLDSINFQSVVEGEILRKSKVLMEKKLTGSEPEHVKLIKDVYDSCMDIDSIKASGYGPLNEFFDNFGGWSVIKGDEGKGNDSDWIHILSVARKQGYGHNFLLQNSARIFPTGPIFEIKQGENTYKHGMDDPRAIQGLEKMVEMAVKLGADPIFARKEMRDAINFEISLLNFSSPEKGYSYYSLEKLQSEVPQIDWGKYVQEYLLGHPIPQNKRVIKASLSHLMHVAGVVENTEKRVVNNYIMWRIADWYDRVFLHVKQAGRWKYCLRFLRDNTGDAVSSYYIKTYFDKNTKAMIEDLITLEQNELLDALKNNDWLDQDVKLQATEKLIALKTIIAIPDWIMNDTELSIMYKEIEVNNGSFIDKYRGLGKWIIGRQFSKGPKEQYEFAVKFKSIGSLLFQRNSILLQAGFFEHVYFNKDRPYFINFGIIGQVIAHEIMGGYVNGAFFFDKNGNWTKKEHNNTAQIFDEKINCFEEQYQNYTTEDGFELKNMNVPNEEDDDDLDTRKWVNMNINILRGLTADNEGLKIAYRAYNTWVKNHGPESQLPGLNYTPKQLFWISFANLHCEKHRPGYYEKMKDHRNSPFEFRVAGSIVNQPDFAKDFQCKEGSNMNPHQTKCQLWL